MASYEYLNERTVRNIRAALTCAGFDIDRLQSENAPNTYSSLDELELAYRLCESARDTLEEVLTLIGKMCDEREDEGC